jgi:hypothetical protein
MLQLNFPGSAWSLAKIRENPPMVSTFGAVSEGWKEMTKGWKEMTRRAADRHINDDSS